MRIPRLRAVVHGVPAPQGSKKANPIYRGSKAKGTRVFTGRVTLTEMSSKVAPWRSAVRSACLTAIAQHGSLRPWEQIAEPVEVRITFAVPRGKTVRRRWPSVAPDIDKLVRSTLDGVSEAAVWASDALVVRLLVEELYQGSEGVLGASGAVVEIYDLEGVEVAAWATQAPGSCLVGTVQTAARPA